VAEHEGVIQFAYNLEPPTGEVAEPALLAPLNAWRRILRNLHLLGQDNDRYEGLGFGNLSTRRSPGASEFVISASQTGAVEQLDYEHLVCIRDWNLERFWVEAEGYQPPSSETLTHAMIYAADSRISWILHGHDPHIWRNSSELAIPQTPKNVGYGSPQMTSAAAKLLDDYQSRPLVFATLGHEDGVFSCGPTARDTGGLLVSYLAKALTLEPVLD
jgi:L-ribulose-5-phosphate 4-epimerase